MGYSLKNIPRESLDELNVLYGNTSLVVHEFSYLPRQIRTNVPLRQTVDGFTECSGLDDIKIFARVLCIARKFGGDFARILHRTSEVVDGHIQIEEGILAPIVARRLEQRVMNLVSSFMIPYVGFSSPGFLWVMYETSLGRPMMIPCLATYLFAFYLS